MPLADVLHCEEIRAHHSRVDQLTAQLAAFVIMLDKTGLVTALDGRITERFGISRAECLGRPVWLSPLFGSPSLHQAIAEAEVRAAFEGEHRQFEIWHQDRDGLSLPLTWRIGPLYGPTGELNELVMSAVDIADQVDTRRALARSNALLDAAMRAGKLGVYDFHPETESMYWSDTLREIWGINMTGEINSDAVFGSIHPDDENAHLAELQQALAPSGPGRHGIDLRFWHAPTRSWRWVRSDGEVTFVNGRPERLIGIVKDITEERRDKEQREILIHELNHRVKNIFGIMLGMIGMTARTSASTEDMAGALKARVESMARAHEIIRPAITLEDAKRPAVDMEGLIEAVVRPHIGASHTLALDGPAFDLRAHGTTSLALLLHEMTTNAAKYGALSNDGVTQGRLNIVWARQSDRFVMTWSEKGGPPVTSIGKAGFGTRLIEMTVRQNLKGIARRSWDENGLTVVIDVPLERVAA